MAHQASATIKEGKVRRSNTMIGLKVPLLAQNWPCLLLCCQYLSSSILAQTGCDEQGLW